MKLIVANRENIVLTPSSKREESPTAFYLDLNVVFDLPAPKRLIIQTKTSRSIHTWSMPWSKFLKQTTIDDLMILKKRDLIHGVLSRKLKDKPHIQSKHS